MRFLLAPFAAQSMGCMSFVPLPHTFIKIIASLPDDTVSLESSLQEIVFSGVCAALLPKFPVVAAVDAVAAAVVSASFAAILVESSLPWHLAHDPERTSTIRGVDQ